MKNEHGAFFDLEYILASCLLDESQKDAVAKTVQYPSLLATTGFSEPREEENISLRESSDEVRTRIELKREKFDAHEESLTNLKETSYQSVSSIKQERFEEPAMDTNNFGNAPTSQDFSSSINDSSFPTESDSDETLNESNNQETLKRKHDPSQERTDDGRFICQFDGCQSSFTLKSNRRTHERKCHGLEGRRKGRMVNANPAEERKPEVGVSVETGGRVMEWDEIEKIRAQYPSTTSQVPFGGPPLNPWGSANVQNDPNNSPFGGPPPNPWESGFGQNGLDNSTNNSFADSSSSSLGNADQEDVKHPTSQSESPHVSLPHVPGVDLSQSKYFTKNPKVITSARGKSLALFNELVVGLSEDWKMRTFEVDTKNGLKSTVKHYLTPEAKVLKTGLAVIEYLRLKGDMDESQLKNTAKMLNINDSKLRNLFEQLI